MKSANLLQLVLSLGFMLIQGSAGVSLNVEVGTSFETDLKSVDAKLQRELTIMPHDTVKLTLSDEGEDLVYANVGFSQMSSGSQKSLQFHPAGSSAKLQVKIDMENRDSRASFALNPGKYHATVYMAYKSSKSIQWDLGTFDFNLVQVKSEPSGEDVFEPLPEIHHKFEPEREKPAKWISYIFSAFCVAPVVFLIAAWTSLGANIDNFPYPWKSTKKFLDALSFIGPLVAFIYVLFQLWWQLNLFQALSYLLPLSLILVFTTRNIVLDVASSSN